MSNLKIKDQKERTTSFWQFVGIAAIPILLSLFVGYQWGHTSDKEGQDYKKLYQKANEELLALKDDVQNQQNFISFTDSVINRELLKEASDWDREYKEDLDNDMVNTLRYPRKYNDAYEKYIDEIKDYRHDNVPKQSKLNISNNLFTEVIEELIEKRKLISIITGDKKRIEIDKGVVEQYEDKEKEYDDEIGGLKESISEYKDNLRDAKSKSERLQEKLDDCQSEKGVVPVQDNDLQHASKILTEIEAIQKNIIPQLRDRILRRDNLSEKVEALKSHLTIISTAANQID